MNMNYQQNVNYVETHHQQRQQEAEAWRKAQAKGTVRPRKNLLTSVGEWMETTGTHLQERYGGQHTEPAQA